MPAAQARTVLRHIRDLIATDAVGRLPDRDLLERFLITRDEVAFETLVRRHGPLVLGICRRVLDNPHDAEDAFQATFLALAQKAHAVRSAASLAGWLYRVAYHVALRARTGATTRRRHEQKAGRKEAIESLDELTARELLVVLDEEIQRLAERQRTLLVFCYLQGHTCDEAARLFGCSSRTLKRWLEQARTALASRLARRGLTLPATLLVTVLPLATADALPPTLAADTARAALPGAAEATRAVALAQGALYGTAAARLKTVAVVALLTGILTLAGALGLSADPRPVQGAAAPAEQPALLAPPKAAEKAAAPADKDKTAVSGRVLGARGEALAKADVAVVGRVKRPGRGGDLLTEETEVLGQGQTDDEGRFRLSVRRLSAKHFWQVHVVARAPGHGLGLQRLNPDLEQPEATVRLHAEQPIRGRLVDLGGQPAAGVKVVLGWAGESRNGQSEGVVFHTTPPPNLKVWPAAATTDAQGRFTFRGLGKAPEINLHVGDDRYAPTNLYFGPPVADREINQSLSPPQVIEGRVLRADTGKPLPNALLTVFTSDREFGSSGGLGGKADAEGRFRLNPNPGKWHTVSAFAPDGEPYLTIEKRFQWPAGKVRHTLDLTLPRGVLVRGKVVEAGSGKPVAKAAIQYHPLRVGNPNYRRDVVTGWQAIVESDDTGAFQLPVLPGPGHLLVSAPTGDYIHEEVPSGLLDNGKRSGLRYYPDALVKLDLPAKLERKEVSVALRRGVSVRGGLTGPGGEAIDKALVFCRVHVTPLSPFWRFPEEVQGGRFQLNGLDPEKTYPVYFLEPRKQWGATVQLSGKQAGAPVKVRLEPCGKATVRFVDAAGKPLAGHSPMIDVIVTPGAPRYDAATNRKEMVWVDSEFLVNVDRHNYWNGPRTGDDGRITLPALIPGMTYHILVAAKGGGIALGREFTAVAGKTLELGDVTSHQ